MFLDCDYATHVIAHKIKLLEGTDASLNLPQPQSWFSTFLKPLLLNYAKAIQGRTLIKPFLKFPMRMEVISSLY